MASHPPEVMITNEEILADLHYPSEAGWVPGSGADEDWLVSTTVRWSDLDANGHMRNTAYADLATDARLAFFADRGLTVQRLLELGIGPVVLNERLAYRSESRLGEQLVAGFALTSLSRDASRGSVESRIAKRGGHTAAVVAVEAGWLSLGERRLVAPPEEVAEILTRAPRAPGFEFLDHGSHQ